MDKDNKTNGRIYIELEWWNILNHQKEMHYNLIPIKSKRENIISFISNLIFPFLDLKKTKHQHQK